MNTILMLVALIALALVIVGLKKTNIALTTTGQCLGAVVLVLILSQFLGG